MEKAIIKRLVKLGIIVVIVLALVVAIGFILDSQLTTAQQDLDNFSQQIAQQKVKILELNSEQKVRGDAASFYEDYKTSESARPENYNHAGIDYNIKKLWQENGLNRLEYDPKGFTEVKNPISTTQSVALKNTFAIKFTSSYDVPVYEFLAGLEDSMPGVISISSVTITRDQAFDSDIASEIAVGKERNLIKGEVTINWFAVVDPLSMQVPSQLEDSGMLPEMPTLPSLFKQDTLDNPVVPKDLQPNLPPVKLEPSKMPPMKTLPAKPNNAGNNSVAPKIIPPVNANFKPVQSPDGTMKLQSVKPQLDLNKKQIGGEQ